MDFNGLVCVVCAMLNGTPNGVVGLDYRLVEAQLVISDWSSNIGSSLIRSEEHQLSPFPMYRHTGCI
ncbi:hypothetical protein T4B_13230 [Trichinella pseudospiralis]|uniref:Uncharacterized protein n=2 Tax=Trichinella pseudospiralis TaxID=6337 RepID=A0A0V1DYP4_TRIPS|nr:hypothetical protein T4E_9301 [Trichinella pseudospiralis]KRY66596.1 hypothetical protein T4A_2682 [Trichinella pseudospiralis]KRY82730.1 hypothetical protein T4D_4819 [Trichinella pseudospiralis]KRZ20348.1 hypothetical protein T4B_13230 [Trichinella pseudospiralis]KRZ37674.1 hypothetical protein T4C_4206 [Trichinella pseudospiralis]